MLIILWIAVRIMAGWYSELLLKRKGTGSTYYSVHFYYHKRGCRKAASKFEGIVFAKNRDHAECPEYNLPFKVDSK